MVSGSNNQLKPEKGKTWNLGLIFEPTNQFSVGIDWWRIHKTDGIDTPTTSQAVAQGLWAYDPTATPPRYYVYTNLLNLAEKETEGIDIDLRGNFRVPSVGVITLRNALTYTYKNREKTDPNQAVWDEYSGTYIYPRIRNVFSASAELGPWTPTLAVRYTGGFYDSDLPLNGGAMDADKVPGYEEVDIGLSYSGLVKGLTLGGGIQNLFDRMPPFSAQNASDNAYTQMGFAELYTNRGRFFYVTARYEF